MYSFLKLTSAPVSMSSWISFSFTRKTRSFFCYSTLRIWNRYELTNRSISKCSLKWLYSNLPVKTASYSGFLGSESFPNWVLLIKLKLSLSHFLVYFQECEIAFENIRKIGSKFHERTLIWSVQIWMDFKFKRPTYFVSDWGSELNKEIRLT